MKITVKKYVLESAQVIRAKNDVRYYLNGIYFTASGDVVATDGHRMFVSHIEKKLKSSVIVDVGKSPTKRYDYAIIDTTKEIVVFYDANDIKVGITLCSVIDGEYPDYNRIIPKEFVAVEEIGFCAGYLADVERVAKLFNERFESVRFQFSGETRAAVASMASSEGIGAKVVVMPMRL